MKLVVCKKVRNNIWVYRAIESLRKLPNAPMELKNETNGKE
ncbi:hypothetical protein Hdeb2414_s0015g00451641 [Helianthus debilis subsp. tardiflorus]